jgi:hypothetical protein
MPAVQPASQPDMRACRRHMLPWLAVALRQARRPTQGQPLARLHWYAPVPTHAYGRPTNTPLFLHTFTVRMCAHVPACSGPGPPCGCCCCSAGHDDERRLVCELGLLLLLGHEPVGLAIAWAMRCLANSPAAQDKLWAELRREGGAGAPWGEREGGRACRSQPGCDRLQIRFVPVGGVAIALALGGGAPCSPIKRCSHDALMRFGVCLTSMAPRPIMSPD